MKEFNLPKFTPLTYLEKESDTYKSLISELQNDCIFFKFVQLIKGSWRVSTVVATNLNTTKQSLQNYLRGALGRQKLSEKWQLITIEYLKVLTSDKPIQRSQKIRKYKTVRPKYTQEEIEEYNRRFNAIYDTIKNQQEGLYNSLVVGQFSGFYEKVVQILQINGIEKRAEDIKKWFTQKIRPPKTIGFEVISAMEKALKHFLS